MSEAQPTRFFALARAFALGVALTALGFVVLQAQRRGDALLEPASPVHEPTTPQVEAAEEVSDAFFGSSKFATVDLTQPSEAETAEQMPAELLRVIMGSSKSRPIDLSDSAPQTLGPPTSIAPTFFSGSKTLHPSSLPELVPVDAPKPTVDTQR